MTKNRLCGTFCSTVGMLILITGSIRADDRLKEMFKDGKFAKAVEYIDKSIPSNQRTLEIWLLYAEALSKSGADKQKTIQAFNEALKLQPSDPRIFAKLGEFHMNQKEYQEAMKHFQKCFLLERSAKAAEAIAACAMHLKLYDKARDAAESAVMLDSNAIESRKILSYIYFNNKEWSEAAQQLEVIVSKIKDDVTYWKRLARCYEELNNREKLITAAERIVALDPKDIRSRTIMVDYYLEKKNNTAALPLLKELAVLTPNDAKIFKHLYLISIEGNQKKDAVLYLKNFLIIDSSDASAFKTLGDLLFEQKNLNEALEAYRKALKLNPSIKGVYPLYMEALLEKKLDDEAVEAAPKAIAAGEMNASVYAAVGSIYRNRKQCDKAITFYQNALKTDVKNLSVLSSLAECQAATGKTTEALLNYRQVVMMNPNAAAEYKSIGDLLVAQNKTDEAMENYRKYLEKSPDDEKIAAEVGKYYHSRKQYREALEYFDKVKSSKLLNVSLLMKIGDCHFQTGNFQKAVEYLSKAQSLNPPSSVLPELLKPLAVSYEKTGMLAEAAKTFEDYVKLPGVKDADAAFKQAILRENSDRPAAISLYQSNIKNFPNDVRSFVRLGILLSEDQNQLKKAIEMLEKAAALNPGDTSVLLKLCEVYHTVGDRSKELSTAEKIVSILPDNLIANQRGGAILYAKKQYADAVKYLQKVTAALPKDYEASIMLADAYLKTNNSYKAMEMYERAKDLKPENVEVWISLIKAAESAGQNDRAAKYKKGLAALDKKIISKDPKAIDSRKRLAEYLFENNDLDAAFPIYKELSSLTPKDPHVFKRLVEISQNKGKEDDALTYLKRYVALDENNAKAHLNLADLYYSQKKFDEALTEYRIALKLDSSLTGFYRKYGEILINKNLEDEAVIVLNAAIKNNEAEQNMFIFLGKIYQKRKQYSSAITMFKKASANDPRNLEIMVMMGECQAASNDIAGAVLTFEQVLLLSPQSVKEYKRLGDLQMIQKKKDEAVKSYIKYLEKNPSDDSVAIVVGMYMYEKKQYQDALRYMEMVKKTNLLTNDHLIAMGNSYYQTGNCQKVCAVLSQLNNKKTPEATLKQILKPLAECYEKTNEPLKAAEAYEAYTALPGVADADAAYMRAFLKQRNEPKTAETYYVANIKAFPNDSRNYIQLGMMYAENPATYSKAVDLLSKASTLDPKNTAVLLKLAQIWNALKKEDKELETYQKLLAEDPKNLESNRRVGVLYMKKNQHAKAIENLEIVLAADPQDAETMLKLSECYRKINQKEKSAELLAKVQSLRKDDPELMFQLYSVYKELGRSSDAENMIKQLIAIKKENKYRILYAGDLMEQKKYDEAKFITDEIIKTDAMNIDGLMLLGRILAIQKKYDEAIETFKMVSYVNEHYAPANYERAEIYRKLNNLERAEAYYLKALNDDPKMGLAELGLARVYKAQNKITEYAAHLNKARSLDPDNKEIAAEYKEMTEQQQKKPQ